MRPRWFGVLLLAGYAGCVVPGLEVGPGSGNTTAGSAGNNPTAGSTATRGGSDSGAPSDTPGAGTAANGGGLVSAGNGNGGNGTAGVAVGGDGSAGAPEPSDCPKGAGMVCHQLLVLDYERKLVTYIDEFVSQAAGAVVWSKPIGAAGAMATPRSLELVDNPKAKDGKAVLVGTVDGFGELDLTNGDTLVSVTTPLLGVSAARRLPDGNTALGLNDAIHVYSSAGTEITTVTLPGPATTPNGLKRDPTNGHYWYAKQNIAYHATETGKLVWNRMFNAGTTPTAVLWRAGSGAYASLGDGATVVEVDATNIVNTVGGKLNFTFLDYSANFTRLPNGNFVIANSLQRIVTPAADAPHVVELTADNKLVWQWGNQTLAREVNDLYVIR